MESDYQERYWQKKTESRKASEWIWFMLLFVCACVMVLGIGGESCTIDSIPSSLFVFYSRHIQCLHCGTSCSLVLLSLISSISLPILIWNELDCGPWLTRGTQIVIEDVIPRVQAILFGLWWWKRSNFEGRKLVWLPLEPWLRSKFSVLFPHQY